MGAVAIGKILRWDFGARPIRATRAPWLRRMPIIIAVNLFYSIDPAVWTVARFAIRML